jgi:hypothetical protein
MRRRAHLRQFSMATHLENWFRFEVEELYPTLQSLREADGVILLHDNSRPHTAQQTQNMLQNLGWETLDSSPCSPVVAPSDFHLISALKKLLSRYRFTCDKHVKHAVIMWLTQQDTRSVRPGWTNLHAVQVPQPSRELC